MTISVARLARHWLAYAFTVAATGAALPLSTPSAIAADMLAQPRPQAVATPLWTGFYIGIHGGGGWGSSRLEDPDLQITYDPLFVKSSGGLAGAQMGGNWQFGSVVVGGELDVSWANIKGSTAHDPDFFLSGVSVDFRALATGTARVGYASGNLLGYAKAGLAWANIDVKSGVGLSGPGRPLDVNHQRTGLTAGAGLEMAFLRNLSARLEYDFVYFGEASINLGTRRNPSNLDHQLHLLKLALNWRFNGDYLLGR